MNDDLDGLAEPVLLAQLTSRLAAVADEYERAPRWLRSTAVAAMFREWTGHAPGGHLPARGSDVEAWIKRQRDAVVGSPYARFALDDLLEDYREHADCGVSLDRQVQGPHPEADPAEVWEVPQPPTGLRAARNRAGLWIRGTGDPTRFHNTDYPNSTPTWAHLLADGPVTDATDELRSNRDASKRGRCPSE